MKKGGCIYMMANKNNTTVYTGVTSDLNKRVWEHKNGYYPKAFTSKYKLFKLVYYEVFHNIVEAIAREKQIKGGSRKKKEALINSINPEWRDLYDSIDFCTH